MDKKHILFITLWIFLVGSLSIGIGVISAQKTNNQEIQNLSNTPDKNPSYLTTTNLENIDSKNFSPTIEKI